MDRFENVFLVVFPFFFVGGWCIVSWRLSVMSGWTRLAERFHYPDKFQGRRFHSQTAKLGRVSYGYSLEMGASEQGLYLVPMLLFRLFHKPLLIPWDELRAEPFKALFFKGYRLTFRTFPGITLDMPNRTFGRIAEFLKPQTRLQGDAPGDP